MQNAIEGSCKRLGVKFRESCGVIRCSALQIHLIVFFLRDSFLILGSKALCIFIKVRAAYKSSESICKTVVDLASLMGLIQAKSR